MISSKSLQIVKSFSKEDLQPILHQIKVNAEA
jgi:hypothetical protein